MNPASVQQQATRSSASTSGWSRSWTPQPSAGCAVVKVGATCVSRIRAAYDDRAHPRRTAGEGCTVRAAASGGEGRRARALRDGLHGDPPFEPGRVDWDDRLSAGGGGAHGPAHRRARVSQKHLRREGDERSAARPTSRSGSARARDRARRFRRFGYGELRTPMVEDTALFVRSVGEETDIVGKEMYTFDDKGGPQPLPAPGGDRAGGARVHRARGRATRSRSPAGTTSARCSGTSG